MGYDLGINTSEGDGGSRGKCKVERHREESLWNYEVVRPCGPSQSLDENYLWGGGMT